MKKKLLAIMLSLVLVFSLVSLTACGDKKDVDDTDGTTVTDTFEGVASETQYDDEEAAVKAFLADEIGGKFTSYENKGALTAEATAELTLSDEDKKDIEAVYEVEITYEVSFDFDDEEEEFMLLAEEVEEPAETYTRTHTAYVIKYKSGKCKYFAPCPKNGEAITRSYFKSLLDSEKYSNCKSVLVGQGIGSDGKIVSLYEDKYTTTVSGKVIKREREESDISQSGEKLYTDTYTDYVFENENKIYEVLEIYDVSKHKNVLKCTEYHGKWTEMVAVYIFGGYDGDDSEIIEIFEELLFTCEKTATGFKSTDKTKKWYSEIISEGWDINGYVEVKDGKIVKMNFEALFNEFMGVKGDFHLSMTLEISEFGKISAIEVPDDYLAEIENAE